MCSKLAEANVLYALWDCQYVLYRMYSSCIRALETVLMLQ
jgi:hypothetical protein